MKIVIAALVRGYPEKSGYESLIKRNKFINKNITSKVKHPVDLILFHEGNITENQQKYIVDKSDTPIKFIDVSDDFVYDRNLESRSVDFDRFKSGYRLMCKFNASGIWKYLGEYKYFMRINEDVIVKKADIKLLNNTKNLNNSFYTVALSDETHDPTNETLPFYLKSLFHH